MKGPVLGSPRSEGAIFGPHTSAIITAGTLFQALSTFPRERTSYKAIDTRETISHCRAVAKVLIHSY